MTSARGAVTGASPGHSAQIRLEIMRQLRQMTAHRQCAAVLSARADRAINAHLAAMLRELAGRRRQAAERSREALTVLGMMGVDTGTHDGPGSA